MLIDLPHRPLTLAAILVLSVLSLNAGATEQIPKRPNLVFILADDLGYGDVGCYGADDLRTPAIDRMASQGIRFTDFYANAAVCTPTRAAFLTGRYQQRLKLDNALYYQEKGRGLPVDGQTLADDLATAGYVTGLSGKWHLGYDFDRQPTQQGFGHFFGLLGGNHHYFEHMDRIGVPDLWLGNRPIQRDGYTTDLITEDAIEFIREHRDRPFFLYLAHAAPHFPWQGPNDQAKDVRPKKKTWQQGDRETYIEMVESMDAGIGQVLKTIDRLGLGERTLVVFSSDNGGHTYSRNAPWRGEKATIWEGGTRVPCIARWPTILEAAQTTSQVAITMDWTATFRRLAGLGADPAGEDGMDLMPVLKGEAETVKRALFWRRKKGPVRKSVEEARAIRDGRWKLVDDLENGQQFLYDLVDDPVESENRIQEFPKLAKGMMERLDAWETEMDGN